MQAHRQWHANNAKAGMTNQGHRFWAVRYDQLKHFSAANDKPNEIKKPKAPEANYILSQVRYLGVF
jgi:hypothetical protein